MALSSACGFGNLHLFAILTMWEGNSPDVIEPCLQSVILLQLTMDLTWGLAKVQTV